MKEGGYMNEEPEIIKISSQNELSEVIDEISLVLAGAFYKDPFYVYIMPDDQKRMNQLQWWFKILLKYTFAHGDLYISANKKGAALWLGPKKPAPDFIKLAFNGLIAYPFKIGLRNFWRMLVVSSQWEALHKKEKDMHYYLLVIGVDPSAQRKGLGKMLMEEQLKKADEEGLFCYLETVTEENVMFYKKAQFYPAKTGWMGKGNPYWIMKRAPEKKEIDR